jgi:hypothetical protein
MMKIYFEDQGQDVLWWIVNEKGIVIDCNLQEWCWLRCIVLDHETLKEGGTLQYYSNKGKFSFKYLVVRVVDLVEMKELISEMVDEIEQDSKVENGGLKP